MARQITVYNRSQQDSTVTYYVAFWFAISSNKRAGSTVLDPSLTTQAERDSINSGDILEETKAMQFPANAALGTVKDTLSQQWTLRFNQIGGVGPNANVGLVFDSGTGWSA